MACSIDCSVLEPMYVSVSQTKPFDLFLSGWKGKTKV